MSNKKIREPVEAVLDPVRDPFGKEMVRLIPSHLIDKLGQALEEHKSKPKKKHRCKWRPCEAGTHPVPDYYETCMGTCLGIRERCPVCHKKIKVVK